MISQRQFNHLQEMGISVWQRKSLVTDDAEKLKGNLNLENIDSEALAKDALFADILISLSLNLAEVSFHQDYIDLGDFNWQFASTPLQNNNDQDNLKVSFADATLTSPSIAQIKQSTSLKRQLWQIVSKHQLTQ